MTFNGSCDLGSKRTDCDKVIVIQADRSVLNPKIVKSCHNGEVNGDK